MLNKVPEVIFAFWVIKIMSTTVGETGADYLAVHVGLGAGITGILMAGLLAAALALQFRYHRYVPWIYWLTVILVSIVGTQITDLLTDRLGVSLYWSTAAFTVALAEELKGEDISVIALCPSTIDTPTNRADMPDADFSQWVLPEAIADVILFLASPAGRGVTGALIPVTRNG